MSLAAHRGLRDRLQSEGAGVPAHKERRRGDRARGYGGHVTFYVEVLDVEAALAKAESLGGTRMMGPDKVPEANIEIALFTDPEGHVIGLVK
jgi:predicted enzyme related to lactoylglutathione lyase